MANPWEADSVAGDDTSFRGVEAQLTPQDIAAASDKPSKPTKYNLFNMGGTTPTPRSVLLAEQNRTAPSQPVGDLKPVGSPVKASPSPWAKDSVITLAKPQDKPWEADSKAPWSADSIAPQQGPTRLETVANALAPDALNKFTDTSVAALRAAGHKTAEAFRNNTDEALQGLAVNVPAALAGYGMSMAKLYSGVMTGDVAMRTPAENLADFNDTANSVNTWLHATFPSLGKKSKSFEDSAALLGIPQEIAHAAGEMAGGGQTGAAIELIAMVAMAKPELKAKAKGLPDAHLTDAQRATLDEALQKIGKTREELAPELMDQSKIEKQSPIADREASAEGTPESKQAPSAESIPPPEAAPELARVEAAKPTELPSLPGTEAIPEGSVRRYHQTHDEVNIPAIEREGLKAGEDHAGNPSAVYASESGHYGPVGSIPTVEFHVPEERAGANGTILGGNVPPENIIATHLPWHETARAIEKDPSLVKRVLSDDLKLGPEDQPAVDYIKQKFSDENYGPNKISPLGGVGKSQGGAIKIFSFNEKPKQAADYEKAKAIVGRIDMPAEEFMAKHPVPTKDTNARLGAGTGSFRTANELKSKLNNPNHAIWPLAYIDDTMHLLKEKFEQAIVETIYPHTTEFLGHYRSRTMASFMTKYAELRKDVPIAQWFEKNASEWFDGKNYNPTIEQLQAKGMSPESAAAWDHLYKGWEATWPDLLDFAQRKGIDAPTRLPGYLPHFTQGAWKVRLLVEDPSKASPTYVATIGAKSAKEAARLQAAADKLIDPANPDHKGLKTELVEPQSGHDLAGMIHGVFEARDMIDRVPALSKLLGSLYEQAQIGSLKSALERQESPQILHQLDRIVADPEFQLSPKQARDALLKMKQLMEAIPAMNMRARFVTDTLVPLEAKGYFDLPKVRNAMEEYVKQFLHIPDHASQHIDGFFQDIFARAGMNPMIPVQAVRYLTSGISKWLLFYSPHYWAQQTVQKVLFMGAVWTAKADLLTHGVTEGSVTKAIIEDLALTSRGMKLEQDYSRIGEKDTLYSYMHKSGHATPTFIENMDQSKLTQDPLAKGLETYTRQGGARVGYTLYRQIPGFSEKDALNAAGRLTDAMNVPYDPEMGKPFAFAKEGQILKATAGMFMEYPMHYLQFISNQMRTLSQASKVSPTATAHAALGLAYTLGTMYAVGGIAGLPFAHMYNSTAEWVNKEMGSTWMTTKELARQIGAYMKKHNFGDDFSNLVAKTGEFGALSTATGADVSGSLQGPYVQLPEVFVHMLGVFGGAAMLAGRWLTTPEGVTKKDLGQQLQNLPALVRGPVEYYLRGDKIADVLDKIKGVKKDMAPERGDINLPGNHQRTPAETILTLFGLRSTAEAAANTTVQIDKRAQAVISVRTARLIQDLNENPTPEKRSLYLKELTGLFQQGGYDVTQIDKELEKYKEETKKTADERRKLRNAGSTAGLLKEKRFQAEKAMEPKFGQ